MDKMKWFKLILSVALFGSSIGGFAYIVFNILPTIKPTVTNLSLILDGAILMALALCWWSFYEGISSLLDFFFPKNKSNLETAEARPDE